MSNHDDDTNHVPPTKAELNEMIKEYCAAG